MISKRGQVTMFVIIGLVILLAVGLVYFLTRAVSVDQPNFDTNDVSIETRPAQLLVTNCLESSMLEGLQLLGSQGGQRYPRGIAYPSYKGESVLFEPYTVPYWRYLDECGHPSGCELSQQPPLCSSETRFCAGLPTGPGSIEEQLEEYIIEDIESCIDGFSSIADQYDIERTAAEVAVDVIFAEGETRAVLEYPIVLRSFSSDNTQTLEQYESSIAVDMLQIYSLADEIMTFARETNYYEYQTRRLISVYADVEAELPPMDQIQFLGNVAGPWVLQEVQETLEQDILPFMNLVRYANTGNGFPLVSPDLGVYTEYANGFYTSFLPKSSETLYNDLEVQHQYMYDPIYLRIGDGSQLIEGQNLVDIDNPIVRAITGLAIKDYRFEYDVSYPLLLSVSDPDALQGQGFSLDFALEVNLRNNYPAYNNFTNYQSIAVGDISLGDFRLPQTYTFSTSDRHTGEALENVQISYVCGEEYLIGYTEMFDQNALLEASLPPCEFGGFIRFQSDGYLGEAIAFNNRDDTVEQSFDLELWPIKEREIIIRKRTIANIQDIIASPQPAFALDEIYDDVDENDSIIFSIERNKTSPYDTPVPLVGFLRYEAEGALDVGFSEEEYASLILDGVAQGYYTQEQAQELIDDTSFEEDQDDEVLAAYTMDLVPGNFTIDSTLIYTPGVFFPAETIDNSENWLGDLVDGDDEVDLDAQEFSRWISGGSETQLELFEADVYRDNPIIFYVFEAPRPNSWSDLLDSPNWDELIPVYANYLQPVLYELE